MPAFASIGCAVILSAAAFGQSPEHPPAFDAADIHVSAPARNVFMRGPRIHGSLYDLRMASMVDLISKAYGINENEILGGPSWLEMDRFDIIAKVPPKSTQETARPMLQALLAERFKLVLHTDNKPMPAFALTAGKRTQLKQSESAGGGGCQFLPPPQQVLRAAPDGGRVNMSGMTLKSMILQAWNITDEMIIGAPKWLDQDRYDIVAKASTSAAFDLDIETVWFMLRALLKERFKMESHMEERPVNAYTLIAVRPKLQKADPDSRTRYKEGPGSDGKDPRIKNPMLARLVTVQNMTMEQFAAKLQNIASGYIHAPVLDATGLEGSWNFTLSFSPAGVTQIGAPGGRGGDAPAQPSAGPTEASDPGGAVTLFEAIEKLGLKLQLQKRPASVLVIDHIEQKPTEN